MPTFIQPTNIHHPDTRSLVWVSKRMGIQPELLPEASQDELQGSGSLLEKVPIPEY